MIFSPVTYCLILPPREEFGWRRGHTQSVTIACVRMSNHGMDIRCF